MPQMPEAIGRSWPPKAQRRQAAGLLFPRRYGHAKVGYDRLPWRRIKQMPCQDCRRLSDRLVQALLGCLLDASKALIRSTNWEPDTGFRNNENAPLIAPPTANAAPSPA